MDARPSFSVRLATQLDALPLMLEGASPHDLERRPSSGNWSARENLAHLARYHEVFLERLAHMLHEERPRLARYRAEDDSEFPRWLAFPTEVVIERLRALRAELLVAVSELTPRELARTGVHPAFGEMSVALWLEFFLVHEAHHLYMVLQRVRERG